MYSSLRTLLPPYASPLLTSSRLAQTWAPPRWSLRRRRWCTGLGPKVSGYRGISWRRMGTVLPPAGGAGERCSGSKWGAAVVDHGQAVPVTSTTSLPPLPEGHTARALTHDDLDATYA